MGGSRLARIISHTEGNAPGLPTRPLTRPAAPSLRRARRKSRARGASTSTRRSPTRGTAAASTRAAPTVRPSSSSSGGAPRPQRRRRQLHRPTKGQHRRDDEEAAAWLQLPGGGAEHALRVVDAIEHVEQRDDVKRPRAGGLLELGDAAIAPPPAQLAPQWSARLERDHVVSPSDFQRGGECARRLSAAGTDVEQPLGLRRRSAIE